MSPLLPPKFSTPLPLQQHCAYSQKTRGLLESGAASKSKYIHPWSWWIAPTDRQPRCTKTRGRLFDPELVEEDAELCMVLTQASL